MKKLIVKILSYFKPTSLNFGDSMKFIGKPYHNNTDIKCNVNDEIIIHPINGKSSTVLSFPAKIVVTVVSGQDCEMKSSELLVLSAVGIKNNINWKGAWLNEYLFSRIEFVKRNCEEPTLYMN